MFTKLERGRYNEDREKACSRLGINERQYNSFRRLGNRLNLKYTRSCNGYAQEFFEQEDNKRENLWTEEVKQKAKRNGLFVYFQTDPRGATIYLDTKEIPENNYTQAVCIY